MLAVTDPRECKRVALRYSMALVPLCLAAPILDITTNYFAFDASLLNGGLVYFSYKFYRDANENSAKRLFLLSVLHLPLLLILMMLHKVLRALPSLVLRAHPS